LTPETGLSDVRLTGQLHACFDTPGLDFVGTMHWIDRIRQVAQGDRCVWIWKCTIALVAVGLIATFAFAHLFTTLVPWDDEGYFLQAYHDFLSRRVLYDQVVAFYGPLTFFSAALLAGFDVANVTHDTFRWTLLPIWIAIAALMAGVVWRWTRRFAPSIATFLLVGFQLRGLAKGVGHPQLWIILGVAVL
jgi:hypothetical protein